MVAGILVLVFYNDTAVKNYFARLNGVAEASPTWVEPQPKAQPEALPEIESVLLEEPVIPSLPDIPEEPEKPKRTRKVAGK